MVSISLSQEQKVVILTPASESIFSMRRRSVSEDGQMMGCGGDVPVGGTRRWTLGSLFHQRSGLYLLPCAEEELEVDGPAGALDMAYPS